MHHAYQSLRLLITAPTPSLRLFITAAINHAYQSLRRLIAAPTPSLHLLTTAVANHAYQSLRFKPSMYKCTTPINHCGY